ncbi:NAD(P)-dependent oxidoreductase [Effusibacillus lacus]|uniref:3-hydroxyisobutyrate dehydrogenase n=1 Tax=Effusibacillus lacus TaxID=1348429 RepID=A0A292YH73_9BACL|nr:NAD(P)-dependent oxidoreductase [Effusibacillus lacus]TCS71612.1 2-hydroxymethylglutarate dehydrogenase [Effusibacillus lacus]GAX90117.1 hypothetical protein EFBL_1743 [Effusibacillus lacus]
MLNIGFIGIGQMGRWMAQHLLESGNHLTVFDTNQDAIRPLEEKGALVAPTLQDLGGKNEIVITMLPNSKIVQSVVTGTGGLLSSMKPGGIIIDMSSSYVLSTKRLAQECKDKGLTLIDAPVSGGVKGAKEATLTIMVGGRKEDFMKVLPILQCMGKTINLVGETGAGHALKAINNYLSAASLYATTEAMILAKKLGIDLTVALETINKSSGQSFSTHYKFPTFILPRRFNSGFSLDLLLKDVKMVTALASDTKVPVFLAAVIEQIYEAACSTGEQSPDHTEIVKFLEKLCDLSLEDKEHQFNFDIH